VRFRIIDKAPGPATASRGLVILPRTLEYYAMLGFADEAIAAGRTFEAVNYWSGKRHAARIPFGEIGRGLTPFPYMLSLPQDEHEKLLLSRLRALGVSVEYRTELLGFEQGGGTLDADIAGPDGVEIVAARFLCGCDGGQSRVREALGVEFGGAGQSDQFYVADVAATGPAVNGEQHVFASRGRLSGVFPMRREGHVRVIGPVPERRRATPVVTYEDCASEIARATRLAISGVSWFSTYRVDRRVAESFRAGRVFLLGDAGHSHSPMASQGMNTGVGDAVNLAWKLAGVVKGRASPALLDSYEDERMGFARRLAASTERAATRLTSRNPLTWLARLALPVMPRLRRSRRRLFEAMSQTALSYRGLAPNYGRVGAVEAGDRLPWLAGDNILGNYAPLKGLGWQVHVYGTASADLVRFCESKSLFLHERPWARDCAAIGLERDAIYLIRPDGHVGFATAQDDVSVLRRYWDSLHVRAPLAIAAR
jgi:2-polyprenyl-6-methoxyphenol hydroxylase-like FAD-dependent oxidoreductase